MNYLHERDIQEDEMQPLVRQVDRILIRVDAATQQRLFSLLTETFQLPIAWSIGDYSSLISGGISSGNVNLELIQLSSGKSPSASLYGLAFEAYPIETLLSELENRGIPHFPPLQTNRPDEKGRTVPLWTTILLGDMLGNSVWTNSFFSVGRLLPSQLFNRNMRKDVAATSTRLLFEKVFPHGAILLLQYHNEFNDMVHDRMANRMVLQARNGGPLGIEAVREITVGVTDIEAAQTRWQQLLAPSRARPAGTWQLGNGPALRLVPHSHTSLLALHWQVRSLEQAGTFLSEQKMLGTVYEHSLTIDSATTSGLEIRLVV